MEERVLIKISKISNLNAEEINDICRSACNCKVCSLGVAFIDRCGISRISCSVALSKEKLCFILENGGNFNEK